MYAHTASKTTSTMIGGCHSFLHHFQPVVHFVTDRHQASGEYHTKKGHMLGPHWCTNYAGIKETMHQHSRRSLLREGHCPFYGDKLYMRTWNTESPPMMATCYRLSSGPVGPYLRSFQYIREKWRVRPVCTLELLRLAKNKLEWPVPYKSRLLLANRHKGVSRSLLFTFSVFATSL